MMATRPWGHIAALPRSTRVFLRVATVFGVFRGRVEAPGCEFAGKRTEAHFRERGGANRGGVQEPTDRGPDKRPQGAALSVGCFCLCFSSIAQCVAPARKVRGAVNALPVLCFSHIAGAGDG